MGFLSGLLAGGIAVASALVVVGSLVRVPVPAPVRPWIVAVAAVPLLAGELGLLRLPLPQNSRQVPQFVTRVPFIVKMLGNFRKNLCFGAQCLP